jgi:anti-sigma regulatory factor (Ser/Thr protein kinase)
MGQHPDWCHQTTLSADPLSPARARAFVVHHLVEHRRLSLVDPVRLVASELATNAVLHARTDFTVTLLQRDDVVTLKVEDDLPTRLPDLGAPAMLDEHGHGMRIVDRMSQSWGVSSDPGGGKLVWASFAR